MQWGSLYQLLQVEIGRVVLRFRIRVVVLKGTVTNYTLIELKTQKWGTESMNRFD